MRLLVGTRRACIGLVLLPWLLPLPARAQAQPGTSAAEARAKAYRQVASACRADYLRYCPASAEPAPQPRDEVICLKDYRADLSLGCRGAVDAARK